MNTLKEVYTKLAPIIGEDIEPYESVQLVETYRRFMRPRKVRIILLAESHVYTSDADRSIRLSAIPGLPNYPTEYARFVYCLAYGERGLTDDPNHPRRDGTPQFWKIFFSCVNPVQDNASFNPILGKTTYSQRISNKVRILMAMSEKGIWLVDTSIVALYNKGTKAPNMFIALRKSWEAYTRDVVMAANPAKVISIGRGVDSIVGGELRARFRDDYQVIEQPNAFLKSEQHLANYRRYYELCK